MTEEEIIKRYRLGPDSRIKFKNDPQYYWIKNISLDRKNVFVTINGAQTYRKLIKNIIQIDNKLLNEMKKIDRKGNISYYNEQDQFHREDGPAVEWADGTKQYYINGKRHREDGPAVEWADGTKQYWVNGQLHREDGPAIEWADGSKSYFVNDEQMSEQDFMKKYKKPNNISSTGTQDFKYELKERIRSMIKEIKEEDKQENVFYEIFKVNDPEIYNKIEQFIIKKYLNKNLKEAKFDGDIKSSLEKIIQQVWAEKDLNKAKSIVVNYLKDSKIKDEDKKRMTLELEKISTKGKLDYYMANALLKYEGSGLNQLKKAELKESKIKCQCQKTLKGNIKKILKEVIFENTNKASLEKNSEIKGDMILLYKLFANQKGDHDWPQIHLTGRYKDDYIHIELLGEEIIFVFTKEGQFKGVFNYKD